MHIAEGHLTHAAQVEGKSIVVPNHSINHANLHGFGFNFFTTHLRLHREAVVAGRQRIEISNDVSITVLSPDKRELEDLERHWYDKLNAMRYGFKFAEGELFDDAFEFLLAQEKGKQFKVKKIAIIFHLQC